MTRLIDTPLLVALTELAPGLVVLLGPQGRIAYSNPAFERLTGWTQEETQGLPWLETFVPEALRARVREALEREEPLAYRILARGGDEREVEWQCRRISERGFHGVVCLGRDVTRQRESESRLHEAQRLAKLGSWDLDLQNGDLWWSDEVYRIFELDPQRFRPSYEAFLEVIHPDDRELVDASYRLSLERREPYEVVHRLRLADGRVKHVHERGLSEYDEAGEPTRTVGTVQDITERHLAAEALERSLAEKETLLKEIHHRVKNNLQIVSSLLHFQAKRLEDPDALAVFHESRQRLAAMLLVHENLYGSDQLSQVALDAYLPDLVDTLRRSSAPSVQVAVEVAPLRLPIETALPLGMIVVELLTNVFKHAFPEGGGGRARVTVRSEPEGLVLEVSDDGSGLPEKFDAATHASFGWQLIRMLIMQLDGRFEVMPGAGAHVRVVVP